MPNGDPRDIFFYPTLKLMIYSYILTQAKILDILIHCARNENMDFECEVIQQITHTTKTGFYMMWLSVLFELML